MVGGHFFSILSNKTFECACIHFKCIYKESINAKHVATTAIHIDLMNIRYQTTGRLILTFCLLETTDVATTTCYFNISAWYTIQYY